MTENKPVLVYRATKRNQKKLDKSVKNLVNDFVIPNDFKPYTEQFKILLAMLMLNKGRPIEFTAKITGLSKKKMLDLEIIEWYNPTYIDSNGVLKKDETKNWLRFNRKSLI